MLTELYQLRKGDVELLIEGTALPHLIVADNKWVGYIPSLKSLFISQDETHALALKRNVEELALSSSLEGSVIKLDFVDPNIPASSMLYGHSWVEKVLEYMDITESTYLLASSRSDMPVFCGHKTLINRLASNFSGDIYVVEAKTLLEDKNVLG